MICLHLPFGSGLFVVVIPPTATTLVGDSDRTIRRDASLFDVRSDLAACDRCPRQPRRKMYLMTCYKTGSALFDCVAARYKGDFNYTLESKALVRLLDGYTEMCFNITDRCSTMCKYLRTEGESGHMHYPRVVTRGWNLIYSSYRCCIRLNRLGHASTNCRNPVTDILLLQVHISCCPAADPRSHFSASFPPYSSCDFVPEQRSGAYASASVR